MVRRSHSYISNTKELAFDSGRNGGKTPETRLVHFIGKDNIVSPLHRLPRHAEGRRQLYPARQRAEQRVPESEGDKISTSRNWAVWRCTRPASPASRTLRYVLTANAPETKDNDFTWKDFQARNNNELVAIWQLREPCPATHQEIFRQQKYLLRAR